MAYEIVSLFVSLILLMIAMDGWVPYAIWIIGRIYHKDWPLWRAMVHIIVCSLWCFVGMWMFFLGYFSSNPFITIVVFAMGCGIMGFAEAMAVLFSRRKA